MDSSVILVPCYWPNCQKQMRLNNLASHLERQHRVDSGFGCEQCGFTDATQDLVRSHLLQTHGRRETPRRAALALAHYYRKRYQETDISTRNIPLSSFWTRGAKPRLESDDHHCHECGDVISPYTKAGMIQHLRQYHHIIVDLNFTSISSRYSRYEFQNNGYEEPGHSIDENENGIESKDEALDEDLHGDEEEESGEPSCNEHHEEEGLDKGTTETHTEVVPLSRPMSDRDSEYRRETFMSCIEETHLELVEDVFKMYETRLLAGSTYRVNQNLPPDTKLDPKKIVYAVLIYGYWRCEVPQCGATFDQIFAIDMHLQAHGEVVLTKWCCGDASCYTGTERIFDDYASFVSHITTEHMDSTYSFAAGRRVPKRDVLVTRLLGQLKFIQDNKKTLKHSGKDIKPLATADVTEMLEDEQLEEEKHCADDDLENDDLDQEMRAWAKFAKFFGVDEDPELDEDSEIGHYCGGFVPLSKGPKSILPRVLPPYYWVETLTGRLLMHEKDARKFIKSNRRLCSLLGTNDPNALRRALFLPCQNVSTRGELQNNDREAHNQQPTQLYADDESQDNNQYFKDVFGCPWPDCEHTTMSKYNTSIHFLTVHLKCDWRCPEEGCEYCGYLQPSNLERHRMSCHIGSSLQCGHQSCNEVLVSDRFTSRGHLNYVSLRNHFEAHFNQNLQGSRIQSSSLDSGLLSDVRLPTKELPLDIEYMEKFGGRSISYLNPDRRSYRRTENHRFLAGHQIRPEDIEVRGSVTCTGFWYRDRYFSCTDSVPLKLDTATLIFVPSRLMFTVAPTCDYCIHVMSLISRSVAGLPLPFHFGAKLGQNSRKRIGIGSFINNHASFEQIMKEKPLRIPPFAIKYKEFQKSSPTRIFIVDFETVRRTQPELPLRLLELTIRDGKGRIVVSCVINDSGVTNLQFEARLKRSGYSSAISLDGTRRIRGPPENVLPRNAKTPKEIIQIVLQAGLNPDSLWVEYSTAYFDRQCMEVLIRDAGMSVESILPPRENCWTVIREFMLCLPGKCKDSLLCHYTCSNQNSRTCLL